MKKHFWFMILLIIIPYSIKAMPQISDITINHTSSWLGEDVFVSSNCIDDNENYTIETVYVDITGPNITIPSLTLEKNNNTYSRTIDNSYLYRTGDYQIQFVCENDQGQNFTDSGMFSVSKLTSSIKNIDPQPAYIGDTIEIDLDVKKDENSLSSDVLFEIYLNDEIKPLKQDPPAYDTVKGWILKIDAPPNIGTYSLEVKSKYDRTEATSSSEIEIKQPIQFDIVDVDKTWIRGAENVTLTVKATYKDETVNLKKEYLNIYIDTNVVDILDISRVGNYSYIKILTPDLSPGSYDLKIKFTYQDFVKQITRKVDYVVQVEGNIRDSSDTPVSTKLIFKSNSTDKTFITDKDGKYSGSLPPGEYDIELDFPRSKVHLYDVLVNDFNDPIRYDYTSGDVDIPGIGVGGIFVYEFAIPYVEVYIEMEYDDSKIPDENKINIFKCNNWNFGRRVCNGDWEKIEANIDPVRNRVKLNVTNLSAFTVGYKKDLHVDFSTEKEDYYLKDIIKILGITEDEDKKAIPDVHIEASILNTNIKTTTKSDNGGVFSIEFQGPDEEGNYTILVKAAKSPFSDANLTQEIRVVKSKKLYLLVPDSIKIKRGESGTLEVTISNLGQTDFQDLNLSLTGIQDEYYIFSEDKISLNAGKEKKVSIEFVIPRNAIIESHTGKFTVEYNDNYLEEKFILSILPAEELSENQTIENKTSGGLSLPRLGLPTASIVIPNVSGQIFLISIFSVIIFSVSIWFRKNRSRGDIERKDIKNLLLDIKNEINKKPTKKEKKIKRRKKKK